MNCIIEIEKLEVDHLIVGYVGLEYKTKKIKYYSYFNDHGIYNSNMLYELDITNPNIANWILENSGHIRGEHNSNLPSEFKNIVNYYVSKHREFNINNNLTTQMIDDNTKYLSTEFDWRIYLWGCIATYSPVNNIIKLSFHPEKWDSFSENEKKENKFALFHEMGHMKVSSLQLEDGINKIKAKTGFSFTEFEVKPLIIDDKNVFLRKGRNLVSTDTIETALEEIMNDYECKLIEPSYEIVYPFGSDLNKLCDGRLLLARYTNGIAEYYDSLTKIINSKDMADELLGKLLEITESISVMEYNKNKEEASKLIKRYYDAKIKH